jgi:hypothetical protein
MLRTPGSPRIDVHAAHAVVAILLGVNFRAVTTHGGLSVPITPRTGKDLESLTGCQWRNHDGLKTSQLRLPVFRLVRGPGDSTRTGFLC